MSFLRDRSPVTPKITKPQGPAMRGSRLSRGSRSGLVHVSSWRLLAAAVIASSPHSRRYGYILATTPRTAKPGAPTGRPAGRSELLHSVQLALDRVEQLLPGDLELVDALVLQDLEHVGEVDADPLQRVEDLLRLGGRAGDLVAFDLAVLAERVEGLLRHGVHRV